MSRWVAGIAGSALALCLAFSPAWAASPDPVAFGIAVENGDRRSIEKWLDDHYSRIQWHSAMRGDVGVIDQASGSSVLVVCTGPEWVGPSDEGLTPSPLASARAVWRIE